MASGSVPNIKYKFAMSVINITSYRDSLNFNCKIIVLLFRGRSAFVGRKSGSQLLHESQT